METTYRLTRLPDGIYVSVEPLMTDIKNVLEQMQKLPMDKLNGSELQELNLKKLGLEAIYTFMGGLVTEHNINELRTKLESKNDTNILH